MTVHQNVLHDGPRNLVVNLHEISATEDNFKLRLSAVDPHPTRGAPKRFNLQRLQFSTTHTIDFVWEGNAAGSQEDEFFLITQGNDDFDFRSFGGFNSLENSDLKINKRNTNSINWNMTLFLKKEY